MGDHCVSNLWRDCILTGHLEGFLEKESHDVWPLRKWQMRHFKLDIEKKTLTYLEGDENDAEMRGEYILNSSSYLSFVNIRPNRMKCELVVSGYSRGTWSYLYLAAYDEENINMWFAALRRTIRGESYEVENIREWITSLKSFTDRVLNIFAEYVSQGIDLSMTEAAQSRLKIEANSLVTNYTKVYQTMLSRLLDEEYHSTDIELSQLQIDVINSALSCFQKITKLKLTTAGKLLETEELHVLQKYVEILKSTPSSMVTVYVRDHNSGRGTNYQTFVQLNGKGSGGRTTEVSIRCQCFPSQINSYYR